MIQHKKESQSENRYSSPVIQKVLKFCIVCYIFHLNRSFGVRNYFNYITAYNKSKATKNSKLYKLGLWVKDDVSGIGTLTYIAKDSGRFGALGHAISDNDTKTIYNINSGEMYPCTVIGLKKGAKGRAGELRGLFMQGKSNKRKKSTDEPQAAEE